MGSWKNDPVSSCGSGGWPKGATMPRRKAQWIDCPGLQEGKFEHNMRDHCWSCAPFWERIPLCPDCNRRVVESGWCRTCRRYSEVQHE